MSCWDGRDKFIQSQKPEVFKMILNVETERRFLKCCFQLERHEGGRLKTENTQGSHEIVVL